MHVQPKHKSSATNDAAHVPNCYLCADSYADIASPHQGKLVEIIFNFNQQYSPSLRRCM